MALWLLSLWPAPVAWGQAVGGIRGAVEDKDFGGPLRNVRVQILETDDATTTGEDGQFIFPEVEPGTYTLLFSRDGFTRQVVSDVVVSPGRLTEVSASLAGEFVEMEEFIVQDLELGGGSEIGLLNLRMEVPALMDSLSAELMSKAGASDAAAALRLVAGSTVQDGKYAVIRGLPDRYVSSQMNGVRLPTADPDKRAVELDQFPAAAIESIRVSKTFTPDQQGDASGGAVNMILKGIPEEASLKVSGQVGYQSEATFQDVLSYDGGGVNFWGTDDGREIQFDRIGDNWTGAVGVSEETTPIDYKWSLSGGGSHVLDSGVEIGGFGSFFYERDSAFFGNGIDDKYWVLDPGDPLTPQFGSNERPSQGNFTTSLLDVQQGEQSVRWGGLGMLGAETENHSLSLVYLYTRVAEDVATLAENTRGKNSLHQFWPEFYGPQYENYDPEDPNHPGNIDREASPYVRTETLDYSERTTQTVQFRGTHTLPEWDVEIEDLFRLLPAELDWTAAFSTATLDEPDKRQFGSIWWGPSYSPGFPPYVPPGVSDAVHRPFKPAANTNLGFFQRTWKDISEDSAQYAANLKLPFEQWSGDEGYTKFGFFADAVTRDFDQDSFANFGDESVWEAPWEERWSQVFPSQEHPIFPTDTDVDYHGEQDIRALYSMADVPLSSAFKVVGGFRVETTELIVINDAEENAAWNPPGQGSTEVLPGFYPEGADVRFEQDDVLPAISVEYRPIDSVTVRGSYSQTVARQTFKELTPIQQSEFLGGDVFVGFPGLKMSALDNYDLRVDYVPYQGGLFSFSYFYKDITDPIEYVQAFGDFIFTTPRNYPEGRLSGFEVEVRQRLDQFFEELEGISVGANATFIDSEVTLPQEEQELFRQPNLMVPITTRDMTNAPEYLYNLYLTYDLERYATEYAVFYTVTGDTLVAGAGQSRGNFIPSVYRTEYGMLNMSLTRRLSEQLALKLQAKNLLNPDIETVYRSKYIDGDKTKTSYKRGIELSLSLSYEF